MGRTWLSGEHEGVTTTSHLSSHCIVTCSSLVKGEECCGHSTLLKNHQRASWK